jgi:hypothetical protein
MAAGDAVTGWATKASNATTDVQPGSSIEWLVHTLVSTSGAPMEVYLTSDGATFTLIDTLPGGTVDGLMYTITNTTWLRLKNTSGATAYNGYMGRVTK